MHFYPTGDEFAFFLALAVTGIIFSVFWSAKEWYRAWTERKRRKALGLPPLKREQDFSNWE